nr:gamma-crystallin N-B-like [Paramormyrops kingsleyae]
MIWSVKYLALMSCGSLISIGEGTLGEGPDPLCLHQHDERHRIELFEGAGFSRQCVELCEDCPFMQGHGFSSHCVNSVRAFGDGALVIYEKPNYRGRTYIVERGHYPTHSKWHAQSPNIQSIRKVVNCF